MPVQIGAKAHNFTDPTGLLSDCHRRVEMFVGMLQAVGEVIDNPLRRKQVVQSSLPYVTSEKPRPSTSLMRKTPCFHPCVSSTIQKSIPLFQHSTNWNAIIAGP